MNKGLIIVMSVCSALIIGVCAFQLALNYSHDNENFREGTSINKIDVSSKTASEATDMLTDKWNRTPYVIRQDGDRIGKLNLNFDYAIREEIRELATPTVTDPLLAYAIKPYDNLKVAMVPEELPEKFSKKINSFHFLNAPYKTKTKNAYVDKSNTKFKIVKEVYGDNIDKDVFTRKVLADIAGGTFEMDYRAKDFYAKPTILSDDKSLVAEREFCLKYLTQKIVYDFYFGKVRITPKQLERLLIIDTETGDVSVNKKRVKKFVHKLAYENDTAYAVRKFKTAGGSYTEVWGGGYGYIINQKKETAQLIKDIESNKTVKRKPVFSQVPYYKGKGKSDIGPDYVEINLSTQSLYVFKNNKIKVSTSVVTGNIKKNAGTPSGVYALSYKDRDATLRGDDWDGTEYESDVSYWMPFNGGIGMHDAPWRGGFGGSIYLTAGSHGCVNMPTWAAATTFSIIEKGWPVVVHY